MLNKQDIKNEIQSISKIGKDSFSINYINQDKLFDVIYESLRGFHLDWIEKILDDEQLLSNLRKSPDYAFTHYLAEQLHPHSYEKEIFVLKIDQDVLNITGMSLKEALARGPKVFDYHDFYGDIASCIIDINLDEEITPLIDTSGLMHDYEARPLAEHCNIHETWEDLFYTEIGLFIDATIIAISKSVHKKLPN